HRRKRERRKLGGAPSRSKRTAWLRSCPSLMKECRIDRLVVGEGAPFDIEDLRRRSHLSFTCSHYRSKKWLIEQNPKEEPGTRGLAARIPHRRSAIFGTD